MPQGGEEEGRRPAQRKMNTFLESLDTLRFNHARATSNSDQKVHAETEIFLNLLFGNRIVLAEPQAFDSLGCVYIMSDFLSKRPFSTSTAEIPKRLAIALMNEPGHDTCRDMVCARLLDRRRTVTSFPEIAKDMRARAALAKRVRDQSAKGGPECVSGEYLDRLDLLVSNLDRGEAVQAQVPSRSLPSLVQWLIDLPSSGIVKVDGEDSFGMLRNLSEGARLLQEQGVEFLYRSELQELDPTTSGLAPEIFVGVFSYVCSTYNAVVADSVQARLSLLSSPYDGSKPIVRFAERLAACAPELTSSNHGSLGVITTPTEDAQGLAREVPWKEVWRIILNDEWQASVDRLGQALESSADDPEYRSRVDDALQQHIELLAQMLSPDWAEITSEGPVAVLKRNFRRSVRDSMVPFVISYFFAPALEAIPAVLAGDTAVRSCVEYAKAWSSVGTVRRTLARATTAAELT